MYVSPDLEDRLEVYALCSISLLCIYIPTKKKNSRGRLDFCVCVLVFFVSRLVAQKRSVFFVFPGIATAETQLPIYLSSSPSQSVFFIEHVKYIAASEIDRFV